ncbi:MAG: thioredoxin family protein [Gemmatimonadales bacterium]
MTVIQILGPGCAKCKATYALIEKVARDRGVPIQLAKVEDLQAIMAHGIMSTPGVVVDGVVVHAGGVPSRSAGETWLGTGTG